MDNIFRHSLNISQTNKLVHIINTKINTYFQWYLIDGGRVFKQEMQILYI